MKTCKNCKWRQDHNIPEISFAVENFERIKETDAYDLWSDMDFKDAMKLETLKKSFPLKSSDAT